MRDDQQARAGSDVVAAALDRLPVVVTVVGPDRRLEVVAGGAAGLLGARRGCTVDLDAAVPPGHPAHEQVRWSLASALAGHPAGARVALGGRWWDLRTAPVLRGAEVAGVLAVALDVDAQVRTERALAAAERRFEEFMRFSPATAALRDEQRRTVWANDAHRRVFGVGGGVGAGADERGTRGPAAALDSTAAVEDRATHDFVLATGSPIVLRGRVLRADGGVVPFSGHRFRLTVPDGGPLVGTVGVDDTELVLVQQELREARQRYQLLFDRSPVGILLVDRAAVVVDANPALCALVDAPLSALRGRSVTDLVDPAGPATGPDLLGGGATGARWVLVRVSDGVRVPVRCTVLAGSGSELVCVVEPARDPVAARTEVSLSERECQVLELRALGVPNARAGERIGLSRRGVDHHLSVVARKLRVPGGTGGLIARAYHLGVLDPTAWPPRVADGHRDRAPVTHRP